MGTAHTLTLTLLWFNGLSTLSGKNILVHDDANDYDNDEEEDGDDDDDN